MNNDLKNKNPYDPVAEVYDDLFSEENLYYGPITDRELKLFDSYVPSAVGNQNALDIGCGTGLHTGWLVHKGYNVVGIDASQNMLRVAQDKSQQWSPRPRFIFCDARDMSQLDSMTFDVITCLGSTLNHLDNWDAFVSNVASRLNEDGRFVFSFDNNSLIAALFWLLKKKNNGYMNDERGKMFRRRMACKLFGKTFQNHWWMRDKKVSLTVELFYDSVKKLEGYLSVNDFRMLRLSGVHLLSFLSPRVMGANSDLDRNGVIKNSLWERTILRFDKLLADRLPGVSANVVGVAAKQSKNS